MDRKKLIIGAAAAILALGGGGAALAAQQAGEEEQIKGGSITAPAGSGEENEATPETPQNETAEEAAETRNARGLQELVKIDRAAAEEAALGAVPGEAREVELDSESGFVVYEVEVAGKDGSLHEVVVDAGNGEVLGKEVEVEEGAE